MLLSHAEVERVFRKVKAVREHIALMLVEGNQPELDPQRLAQIIADMYNLNIKMYEVFASGDTILGNVERYLDGRAIVMVKAEKPEPVIRFVKTKELCHLMNDEADDWSNSPMETIALMRVEFKLAEENGGGTPNPTRTQMSEYLAEIAATALMYPCEFHESDRAKIAAGETTLGKIGHEHNIPAWIIEQALDHASIYAIYHTI
jgi:hypothetical protein